jgi:hypothetical protein
VIARSTLFPIFLLAISRSYCVCRFCHSCAVVPKYRDKRNAISHVAQGLTRGAADEIVPRDSLLPRAWELARYLKKQNALMLRYTR